jgi:hypothetical protein
MSRTTHILTAGDVQRIVEAVDIPVDGADRLTIELTRPGGVAHEDRFDGQLVRLFTDPSLYVVVTQANQGLAELVSRVYAYKYKLQRAETRINQTEAGWQAHVEVFYDDPPLASAAQAAVQPAPVV